MYNTPSLKALCLLCLPLFIFFHMYLCFLHFIHVAIQRAPFKGYRRYLTLLSMQNEMVPESLFITSLAPSSFPSPLLFPFLPPSFFFSSFLPFFFPSFPPLFLSQIWRHLTLVQGKEQRKEQSPFAKSFTAVPDKI